MGAASEGAEPRVIYFAHGSNMDPAQMRARCATARARGIGFLADHRLCFPRWSDRRLHAVASIEESAGERVWGVLYDMSEMDWMALHRFEGHFGPGHAKNGYDLKEITVSVELAEAPGHVVAHTYIANPHPERPEPGLTSSRYLKQLVDGAVAHRLPDDYLAMLRQVPTFD
jgi:AIG2-like family